MQDPTSNYSARTAGFMEVVSSGQHTLARTEWPGAAVSTVRLMDDKHGARWNTLVIGGPLDDTEDGYRTLAEAKAGHEAMVARVQAALAVSTECANCETWQPTDQMHQEDSTDPKCLDVDAEVDPDSLIWLCDDFDACQVRAGGVEADENGSVQS